MQSAGTPSQKGARPTLSVPDQQPPRRAGTPEPARPAIVDVVVPMTPAGACDLDSVPPRLRTPSIVNQLTAEQLLARMDHYGIGQSIIPARRYGPHWGLDYEAVHSFVAGHPRRLFATAGVDPLERMDGVRRLDWAVRELGFVGAHSYPTWSDVPADDRLYYPYYAKCEELGVPFQVECMNGKGMRSHGHPRHLERVACDFPELRLVAIHTGYPWERELVATAEYRRNFFIGCDTLPPALWSQDLLGFIRGETYAMFVRSLKPASEQFARTAAGELASTSDRCVFGSNYLSINLDTALPAIEAFGLEPEIWAKLMSANARRLYGLPDFTFDEQPSAEATG